jgi:uncharacterized membrane protein (TIGR01218 family)
MFSEVHHIHKNMRYRMIKSDNSYYVFDLDSSFLVFFFPFLNWMKSHIVYKVSDNDKLEQLNVMENKNKLGAGLLLFTGGLSVFGGNLLSLVVDRFDIQTTQIVSYCLLLISTFLVIYFRFRISRKSRKKLCDIVQLEELETEKIRIRPQSLKHFSFVLVAYIFYFLVTLASSIAFIELPNYILLLCFILFLFFTLIVNGLTLKVGKNKIKLKNNKSAD